MLTRELGPSSIGSVHVPRAGRFKVCAACVSGPWCRKGGRCLRPSPPQNAASPRSQRRGLPPLAWRRNALKRARQPKRPPHAAIRSRFGLLSETVGRRCRLRDALRPPRAECAEPPNRRTTTSGLQHERQHDQSIRRRGTIASPNRRRSFHQAPATVRPSRISRAPSSPRRWPRSPKGLPNKRPTLLLRRTHPSPTLLRHLRLLLVLRPNNGRIKSRRKRRGTKRSPDPHSRYNQHNQHNRCNQHNQHNLRQQPDQPQASSCSTWCSRST